MTSFGLHAQDSWTTYRSDAGRFTIDTPAELKDGTKTILTAIGEMTVYTLMTEGAEEDNNYLYLINYSDYPKGTFDPDSTQIIMSFFESTINASIESLGGELIYDSDISIKNHPGRLYRIKYNDGSAVVKGKIYLVGDRFYSLQVFTLTEQSLNDEMNAFLDSFRIL